MIRTTLVWNSPKKLLLIAKLVLTLPRGYLKMAKGGSGNQASQNVSSVSSSG
jgi:hypothetical protein